MATYKSRYYPIPIPSLNPSYTNATGQNRYAVGSGSGQSNLGPGQTVFDLMGRPGQQLYNARYSSLTGPGDYATERNKWYSESTPQTVAASQNAAEYARMNPSNPTGLYPAPVYNPQTGTFDNPQTGRPYYEQAYSPQASGGQQGGATVPYSGGQTINPNDPYQRYRAVSIEKNPQVSAAAQAMADSLTQTATQGLQNFDAYKKNFTDAINRAQGLSAAATDIGPLAARLRGLQSGYSSDLDAASQRYNQILANTKAAEEAVVQQGYDYLPMYDAAAQSAANEQMAALQRNIGRYKSASGTPMGLGSSEQQMLLGGARQILVPMEQAKIQQRYNILNQLAMPSVLDIANRQTAKVGTFDPMVAAAQFQSGTATEQTIHQLAGIASQMAYQDAIRYMQSLGVPELVQQQIMSGNIQNAAALNAVFAGSRYQGLQDILGANITPSQNYSFRSDGYPLGVSQYRSPGAPQYYPQSIPANMGGQPGMGGGGLGSDAAVFPGSALPGYSPYYLTNPIPGYQVSNPSGRAYPGSAIPGYIPGYSQLAPTPFPRSNAPGWQQRTPAAPVARLSEAQGHALGTQTNSRWDSALGALVDKTTGQITGYGASGVNLPYY